MLYQVVKESDPIPSDTLVSKPDVVKHNSDVVSQGEPIYTGGGKDTKKDEEKIDTDTEDDKVSVVSYDSGHESKKSYKSPRSEKSSSYKSSSDVSSYETESINTEQLLLNDVLYMRLEKMLTTKSQEQSMNVADVLLKISNSLIEIQDSLKELVKSSQRQLEKT